MKKKEFENHINSLSARLYSFSFALIPDDLQAQQMVVDALTLMAIEEKDLLNKILYDKVSRVDEENNLEGHLFLLKKCLFKHLFKIGQKRFQVQRQSFIFEKASEDNFGLFYQLDIHERALLFLKDKTEFSFREIGDMVNLADHDLTVKLNLARSKLLRLLGTEGELAIEFS